MTSQNNNNAKLNLTFFFKGPIHQTLASNHYVITIENSDWTHSRQLAACPSNFLINMLLMFVRVTSNNSNQANHQPKPVLVIHKYWRFQSLTQKLAKQLWLSMINTTSALFSHNKFSRQRTWQIKFAVIWPSGQSGGLARRRSRFDPRQRQLLYLYLVVYPSALSLLQRRYSAI
jgi:hypothetical protein